MSKTLINEVVTDRNFKEAVFREGEKLFNIGYAENKSIGELVLSFRRFQRTFLSALSTTMGKSFDSWEVNLEYTELVEGYFGCIDDWTTNLIRSFNMSREAERTMHRIELLAWIMFYQRKIFVLTGNKA